MASLKTGNLEAYIKELSEIEEFYDYVVVTSAPMWTPKVQPMKSHKPQRFYHAEELKFNDKVILTNMCISMHDDYSKGLNGFPIFPRIFYKNEQFKVMVIVLPDIETLTSADPCKPKSSYLYRLQKTISGKKLVTFVREGNCEDLIKSTTRERGLNAEIIMKETPVVTEPAKVSEKPKEQKPAEKVEKVEKILKPIEEVLPKEKSEKKTKFADKKKEEKPKTKKDEKKKPKEKSGGKKSSTKAVEDNLSEEEETSYKSEKKTSKQADLDFDEGEVVINRKTHKGSKSESSESENSDGSSDEDQDKPENGSESESEDEQKNKTDSESGDDSSENE